MEKKFLDIYNELGDKLIEELYMYSCLKASGFDDELGQKLIPLLRQLWLDDYNCRCISQLSDNLYAVYEEYENEDFLELTSKELLELDEFESEI